MGWFQPPKELEGPTTGQLHLWMIEVNRGFLPDCLSIDELIRAEKFSDQQNARAFRSIRSAVRRILGRYLDIPAGQIVFRYGPLGKPEIGSPATDLRFNLAHAEGKALLAVTSKTRIGVDIEPLRERTNALKIAERVFPPSELGRLKSVPAAQFDEQFLLLWTALEARVKSLGQSVFGGGEITTPCTNFRPETDWIAAVALESGVPAARGWALFSFGDQYFVD